MNPAPSATPAAVARRAWYDPRSVVRSLVIRPRLLASIAVGAATFAAASQTSMPATLACGLAWNAGGVLYIVLSLIMMARVGPEDIEARAAAADESRVVILLIILAAIASSFGAILGLLQDARTATAGLKFALLAMAGLTIFTSWLLTQILFALHYAHDFYRPDDKCTDARHGLQFPGTKKPDFWDFLYFATSIGASSQTSDTAITSRSLRRLVTLHAIVSFVFNTSILALTINLAASLAG